MKLSTSTLLLLQDQYNHELQNYYFYSRLASLCDYRGLTGISGFLNKQAKGELDHAECVKSFIEARNETIGAEMKEIIVQGSQNILMIFTEVLAREVLTTEKLAIILKQARIEYDVLTEQWLMGDSGLLKEQTEEENTIQTILDRINTFGGDVTNPCVLHDIDTFVGGL